MNNWIVDPSSAHSAEKLINILASRCDGAHSTDGAGFSKYDVHFGKSLAERGASTIPWTQKQAEHAINLLRKYQKQLDPIVNINKWMAAPIFNKKPISLEDISLEQESGREISFSNGTAKFVFKYNGFLVSKIKELACVHNGKDVRPRWDPADKIWSISVNVTNIENIINFGKEHNFKVCPTLINYMSTAEELLTDSKFMLTLNESRHITLTGDIIVIAVDDLEIYKEFESAFTGKILVHA